MLTALLQGPVPGEPILPAIDAAAAHAAARGARILVCPEMSATGYRLGSLLPTLAEQSDGPISQAVSAIARGRPSSPAIARPTCSASSTSPSPPARGSWCSSRSTASTAGC